MGLNKFLGLHNGQRRKSEQASEEIMTEQGFREQVGVHFGEQGINGTPDQGNTMCKGHSSVTQYDVSGDLLSVQFC